MIHIPVELWRFGDPGDATDLGRIEIVNDGTGTSERGNYEIRVYGKTGERLRTGWVKDWPRLSRPVFDLLAAGLTACGYKGRKQDGVH